MPEKYKRKKIKMKNRKKIKMKKSLKLMDFLYMLFKLISFIILRLNNLKIHKFITNLNYI